MFRANYIGAPAFFDLGQACRVLVDAYGPHVYLVGSSLERRDYRDVDVRCILPDEEFDRLFPGIGAAHYLDPRWSVMASAYSHWLGMRSGLPVDFQFQRRTEANAEYAGQRSALGLFYKTGDHNAQ